MLKMEYMGQKALFKFYEVGGKIRDELLGLSNKDVDYVAVPCQEALDQKLTACEMFTVLCEYLKNEGFEIFLITRECFTIRAKFPKDYKYQGVADFVMARKEIGYIPGTRTPIVEPGTLHDDLSRRDFTVNALAKDPDTGEIIDYFEGLKHLEEGLLKTPLDPETTFNDDPLRILRGIRFAITKGFRLGCREAFCIDDYPYFEKMGVVSEERIREELYKCFRCDTRETLKYLMEYKTLYNYIFTRTNLWLKPTNEK